MSHQQTNRPAAIKRRKKQKRYHDARRKDGLRNILADPVSRYFLFSLIDEFEPLGDARTVNWIVSSDGQVVPSGHDPYGTFANNAVRLHGVRLIKMVHDVNPSMIMEYMKNRQPPVEDDELQEETEDVS